MKNIKIGCSQLTGSIFAGKINKTGNMWLDGKVDVTDMATSAVAESLLKKDEQFHFSIGNEEYVMKVIKK